MNNKIIIIILFLNLLFISSFGQSTHFLTDTTDFIYTNKFPFANADTDSVVYIKDYTKRFTDQAIYFDRDKRALAYKSVVRSDTCIISNYWRNGKLKSRDTYLNKGKYDYRKSCSDLYCENGQLIVHWCAEVDFFVIRYYCSGKKQMTWTHDGIGAKGPMVKWYENGQKFWEVNYINNMEEGEWTYWDEKGKLLKIEIWKEGVFAGIK